MSKMRLSGIIMIYIFLIAGCKNNNDYNPPAGSDRVYYTFDQFVMGADLSYVNQILDHGGVYSDAGLVNDPYKIFKQYGSNVIRFRLFHTPAWTQSIYGSSGTQMYNDFNDVKKGIRRAKKEGMKVLLDFHYSDSWADPSRQVVPAAWQSLSLDDLKDSVYNYTFKTLHCLDTAGLMPEYVQPGNEINPGFLLPQGSRWNDNEDNFIILINSAIKGIRDAGSVSLIKPEIIIHIAQPENVAGWFNGLAAKGLADFDIIGISYYYMWSGTALADLSEVISTLKSTFQKEIMIMETTYPWTTLNADNYANIINTSKLLSAFPATPDGQYKYLHALVQEVIDGRGIGIFIWEPAWITSSMKDLWGTGSSWDCNTFFDFAGNTHGGILFMSDQYDF